MKNCIDFNAVILKEPNRNKKKRSARIKRCLAFCKTNPERNKKGSIEKTKKVEASNNEVKIPSRHSRSIFNSEQIQHMKESYLVKK